MQASTVALGVAAIDARLARVAASGDGGYRRRGAEGGCTACTRCALSSWQLPSTRSAMCARGAVCAELPLASQPSMRVHLHERARVPADAAAVAIRRARAVRPGRRRGATGAAALAQDHPAASTRCGRPSRGHAMPCDASVLAPGVTKCRWRRHRCPYRASPVPLEGPPSTRAAHVWPPPAAEGHGCRCAEVSALLAPSARHHRGRCRRRAVPMHRRRGSAARCPGGRGRRRKRCEDAAGAARSRRHWSPCGTSTRSATPL